MRTPKTKERRIKEDPKLELLALGYGKGTPTLMPRFWKKTTSAEVQKLFAKKSLALSIIFDRSPRHIRNVPRKKQ